MGVKTKISLCEAQELFSDINILSIMPTDDGVIDTTYIVETTEEMYVLKRYERADKEQISDEVSLLKHLQNCQLNVPSFVTSSNEWNLFSYIKGQTPSLIGLHEIQALGRFLGRLHRCTCGKKSNVTPFKKKELISVIKELRRKNLLLAKRLKPLETFADREDGIIHGDLFPDNAKFDGKVLGVFDFIEAGNGSFGFDAGVLAMSWIGKKKISKAKLQMFLRSYNQHAPQKLTLNRLLCEMKKAALVYCLKRFTNENERLDHKEMLVRYQTIKNFT